MKVVKKEIAENVFFLVFEKKSELTKTFLRFQENYESPKFRNKVFSLREYKSWYIKNDLKSKKYNKFFYYSQWGGFNIPSSVLTSFYENKFKNITKKERFLLDLFKKKMGQDFYIIATFKKENMQNYIDHEMAHAFFSTQKKYKQKVLSILDSQDSKILKPLQNFLKDSAGYHPDVYLDETQAYLVCGYEGFAVHGYETDKLKPVALKVRRVYERFWQEFKKNKQNF